MDVTRTVRRLGRVQRRGAGPTALPAAAYAVSGLGLVVLSWAAADGRPVAVLLVALAIATPALVWIDAREHRLPNRITIPLLVLALPIVLIDPLMGGLAMWVPAVTGLATGTLLLCLSIIGGLGMGDVKLGMILGFGAGCFGVSSAIASLLIAMLTGGLAGGAVLLAVRIRRRTPSGSIDGDLTRVGGHTGSPTAATRIAFGPFLLLGFWCVVALNATLVARP